MRLKVGVIDSDVIYIKRFVSNAQRKLADEMELYVYTNVEQAYSGLKHVYPDVLLVADEIAFDCNAIPRGIVVIYFSKRNDVEEINGFPVISKYHQKLVDIYKNILNIYAENSSSEQIGKKKKKNVKMTLFMSVQGGVGTTTVAAAYAVDRAKKGNKVFLLSLDMFGNIALYFSGDGKQSLTDILNALKKDINIEAKFHSAVKTDHSGVNFFDVCKNAYDMVEFKDEELKTLLENIQTFEQGYDEIVLEYSGHLDKRMLFLMKQYSDYIFYVNDGSTVGNIKFQRFCEAMKVIEYKEEEHILNKMRLIYNQFSSKTGEQLIETAIPVIGGINRFIGLQENEIIYKIADLSEIRWE